MTLPPEAAEARAKNLGRALGLLLSHGVEKLEKRLLENQRHFSNSSPAPRSCWLSHLTGPETVTLESDAPRWLGQRGQRVPQGEAHKLGELPAARQPLPSGSRPRPMELRVLQVLPSKWCLCTHTTHTLIHTLIHTTHAHHTHNIHTHTHTRTHHAHTHHTLIHTTHTTHSYTPCTHTTHTTHTIHTHIG